eukprot:SAG11_NODE_37475_length_256_cov_2.280255_2_plen_35_part_01
MKEERLKDAFVLFVLMFVKANRIRTGSDTIKAFSF